MESRPRAKKNKKNAHCFKGANADDGGEEERFVHDYLTQKIFSLSLLRDPFGKLSVVSQILDNELEKTKERKYVL